MITKLYAIYDRKSGLYGRIFHETNDATAVRFFNTSFSTPQAQAIGQDCELYCLGTYSDYMGKITALEKPAFVVCYGQPYNPDVLADDLVEVKA